MNIKKNSKWVLKRICKYIGITVFLIGSLIFTMSMLIFSDYFIDGTLHKELVYVAGGGFVMASIGYIVFLITDR